MLTLKHVAAVAGLALAVGAPALAQQQPSGDGTDANGPITILKNMQAEPGGVVVRINGREIDHLRSAAYDDVTTTVHAGTNTMTLTWSRPVQRFNFKVAYAPTRNNFKNVVVVQIDASNDGSLRSAGSKSFTFTIPG